jgi:hypothetical protein
MGGAEVIPSKHSLQNQNKAVDFGQRPRPLHYRYTRTDTCVRWDMSVKYIAVKFFPFHFRNRHVTAVSVPKPPFAVSEVKPPPGSRSGLKNPLRLLESTRYNSFSRRGR